jgi:hypothetical protein
MTVKLTATVKKNPGIPRVLTEEGVIEARQMYRHGHSQQLIGDEFELRLIGEDRGQLSIEFVRDEYDREFGVITFFDKVDKAGSIIQFEDLLDSLILEGTAQEFIRDYETFNSSDPQAN